MPSSARNSKPALRSSQARGARSRSGRTRPFSFSPRFSLFVGRLLLLVAFGVTPILSWAQSTISLSLILADRSASEEQSESAGEERTADALDVEALLRFSSRKRNNARPSTRPALETARHFAFARSLFASAVDLRPLKLPRLPDPPFLRRRVLRLLN